MLMSRLLLPNRCCRTSSRLKARGMNRMVDHEWIEQKLIQLEKDRCSNQWSEIRERQLQFLRELYASGQFSSWTTETITQQLVLIFHGY